MAGIKTAPVAAEPLISDKNGEIDYTENKFLLRAEKMTMLRSGQEREAGKLADKLVTVVGDQHVLTDSKNRELHSLDFSEEPQAITSVVILPGSTEEVVEVVRLASSAGFDIVPRGGGMSYTLGYVPKHERSIIVDLRRMNRIVEINTDDLYITVEAGVTWKQIYDSLGDKPCRIHFIGTFSGIASTVGGALGNNAIGIGKGEVADDLLGMEIVLSDGRIVRTGGWATSNHTPSLRHFGPDLTGLFVHDGGAFGIKTKATFRLVRKPGGTSYASFGFQDMSKMVATMCECCRVGVAVELITFGRYHHEQFSRELTLARNEAMEMLGKIIKSSSSRLRGFRDIFRCVRPGGLKFLRRYQYSFHAIVDGFDQKIADRGLAAIKRIAETYGGKEIPPTLAIGLRVDPFQPVDRLIQGIEGACSFPSNCVVPLSKAQEFAAALESFFQDHAPGMQKYGLDETRTYLMVQGMFCVEPIIYWRDSLNPLRLNMLDPERRKLLSNIPQNSEARKAAIDLRRRMHSLFREFNGAHLQIGKFYPYREAFRNDTMWGLMEELKHVLDPHHLMNPGALGLS